MKKTYNLGYEKGKYYLEYSMPKNDEGRLVIDEKKMELDSVKLYKMFFEKSSTCLQLFVSFTRLIVENYQKTETK